MRTILRPVCFSVLFLFFSTITNATDYYVDKNASGSNNGTSWANAWESFSAINWGQIQPGDIIYISGGSDSTVYYETLSIEASGTASNPITIRNSYEPGHNGRVIIDGQSIRSVGISVGISSSFHPDYIYIKGFEIRESTRGVHLHYTTEFITLDSLTIYDFYGQAGIMLQGNNSVADGYATNNVVIKNCSIVSFVDLDAQTDGIYATYAANTTLYNNYIHLRNRSLVNNHSDAIQAYRTRGWKIYNNVVIADSNVQGMAMILGAESTNNDSVIIYNNYFYMGGIWYSGAPDVHVGNTRWYSTNNMPPTIITHNTFVGNGPSVGVFAIYYPATFINNIFAQYGAGTGYDNWLSIMRNEYGTAHPVDLVRHNLFWREWGTNWGMGGNWTGNGNTGSVGSWSAWTTTYGGTGVNANPLFVDAIGYVLNNGDLDGELQGGSPAIDEGENIQTLIESMGFEWKDINGNPRDSSPTIGAYELTTGGGNNPPLAPSNPNPANGSTNQPSSLTLNWNCSDPDGDPLTYNIYFGTNSIPPLALTNQSNNSFNPGQLDNGTTYYWKIVANDNHGASTTGPIWNFTTEPGAGGDTTPPELVAIQIVDPDEIVIDFSEPIDSIQINNLQNYSISNNINVLSAELEATQQRLCLTTSNHDSNFVYSIEINEITDTAGNLISQLANSAFYKLLDIGQINYVKYLMADVEASATTDTNTSPQKTLDGLVNGDPDPNSRWAAEIMPQWLQYDLGSVKEISLIASSFYRWNMGRIYQYSIQISDDASQWNEIISNQTSSSQEWTLNELPILTYARYVRVICLSNNESNWAGLWENRIFGPAQVPVELISFTADVYNGNNVKLQWRTATENNNQGFEIERASLSATPVQEWERIGFAEGHGTTTEPQSYRYTDNNVEAGTYTYRLKQIDFDGTCSYSDAVEVDVTAPLAFNLNQNYPNPFNPGTRISWQSPISSWQTLKIYDIIGNEVATLLDEYRQAGSYEVEWNASDLPSGVYFYQLKIESFVETKRMILLK